MYCDVVKKNYFKKTVCEKFFVKIDNIDCDKRNFDNLNKKNFRNSNTKIKKNCCNSNMNDSTM